MVSPLMDLPPPISGSELKRKLTEKIVHIPLAEGFLYKDASLMISSQPAVGKSTLAIQAAYELSTGLPLFGGLIVPKPLRVWYIQMERPETESLERLQLMKGDIDVDWSNLFIDVELQALNFLSPSHFDYVLSRGKDIDPDLVIIDPLYGIATGLSKDEIGSGVSKMFTVLKKTLKCTLMILHHTVKNPYEIIQGIKVPKDDPFYGAQWLKAHVTASYLAENFENGIKLVCKKDAHGRLIKELTTSFDHDTYLSTIVIDNLEVAERYKLFINSLLVSGKRKFYFEDARTHLGCAPTTLREFHRTPQFRASVVAHKVKGHRTLYEVTKEI